jgi:hypothetical protein
MGRVREVGADAAVVVTPYYNKPNQAGLLEHYRACVRAHPGFPIVVYNVPGRTGGDILPETMQRLCELDEIVAIKEATASMIRAVDLREKCGARLTMLSGDDFRWCSSSPAGDGVISVSSNVAPRLMRTWSRRRGGVSARGWSCKSALIHCTGCCSPTEPDPGEWHPSLAMFARCSPPARSAGRPTASPWRRARRLGLLSWPRKRRALPVRARRAQQHR